MECSIERKKLASQEMALYKEESMQVCRPWTNLCLDFAGPVKIKGDVNTRSRGKSWILVLVCRNTKAVCLLATSGYSTADFLCKWEEFISRKGKPRSVVSDRGSQLVRAGMVLAERIRKTGSGRMWSGRMLPPTGNLFLLVASTGMDCLSQWSRSSRRVSTMLSVQVQF